MVDLSPIPYRTPFLDAGGLVARPWQQYFEALHARAGGAGSVSGLDEVGAASEGNEFNEDHAELVHLARRAQDLAVLQAFDVPLTPQRRDVLSLFEALNIPPPPLPRSVVTRWDDEVRRYALLVSSG